MGPRKIREKIIEVVNGSCETCSIEIGSISLFPFRSEIKISDIHFSAGDPKATAGDVRISEIVGRVNLSELRRHKIHIENLMISDSQVKILEGDLKNSASKKEIAPHFEIDQIEVVGSDFVYTREHKGRKAPIHVGKIQATIERTENVKFRGQLNGVLENSGKVDLKVTALPFADEPYADIDLRLSEQNLEKMNPYFETDDGIKLKGNLLEGHSVISIRKNQLHGYVQAKYQGLNMKFEKTKERTALAAFFSNLVKSFTVRSKNTDEKHSDQIKASNTKRLPDETLLSFIFRGMKEAALDVATNEK